MYKENTSLYTILSWKYNGDNGERYHGQEILILKKACGLY